jgi:hypothetical protein
VLLQTDQPNFLSQVTTGVNTNLGRSVSTSSLTNEATTEDRSTSTSRSSSATTSATVGTDVSSSNSHAGLVEFQHPFEDNELRLQRRQIDLQDEILAQELFAMRVPDMATILTNESRILDLDINQAQLTFLATFLTPPIDGVITGIYKDIGETVQPGEAVMRIENDNEILVVGRVNHRGRLAVGMQATLTCRNLFEDDQTLILAGPVVAVRGHDADNDEWDVIMQFDNVDEEDDSKRKVPLNYTFDYHDVDFTVS